jgi:hypothetical protein
MGESGRCRFAYHAGYSYKGATLFAEAGVAPEHVNRVTY